MPFEDDLDGIEEGLEGTLRKVIEWADRRIAEQLGDVASTESLIELREDFEGRIRSYFKEAVRETNSEFSTE
jgi:hypothetical protein